MQDDAAMMRRELCRQAVIAARFVSTVQEDTPDLTHLGLLQVLFLVELLPSYFFTSSS